MAPHFVSARSAYKGWPHTHTRTHIHIHTETSKQTHYKSMRCWWWVGRMTVLITLFSRKKTTKQYVEEKTWVFNFDLREWRQMPDRDRTDHRSDVLKGSDPQRPPAHPRNTEYPSIWDWAKRERRRAEMKQNTLVLSFLFVCLLLLLFSFCLCCSWVIFLIVAMTNASTQGCQKALKIKEQ